MFTTNGLFKNAGIVWGQVLRDNFEQLDNMSGREFVSKFFNRTFNLPSRTVTLDAAGTRECDVFVKQFRKDSEQFEVRQ